MKEGLLIIAGVALLLAFLAAAQAQQRICTTTCTPDRSICETRCL
jgi:hypothetical protein